MSVCVKTENADAEGVGEDFRFALYDFWIQEI